MIIDYAHSNVWIFSNGTALLPFVLCTEQTSSDSSCFHYILEEMALTPSEF